MNTVTSSTRATGHVPQPLPTAQAPSHGFAELLSAQNTAQNAAQNSAQKLQTHPLKLATPQPPSKEAQPQPAAARSKAPTHPSEPAPRSAAPQSPNGQGTEAQRAAARARAAAQARSGHSEVAKPQAAAPQTTPPEAPADGVKRNAAVDDDEGDALNTTAAQAAPWGHPPLAAAAVDSEATRAAQKEGLAADTSPFNAWAATPAAEQAAAAAQLTGAGSGGGVALRHPTTAASAPSGAESGAEGCAAAELATDGRSARSQAGRHGVDTHKGVATQPAPAGEAAQPLPPMGLGNAEPFKAALAAEQMAAQRESGSTADGLAAQALSGAPSPAAAAAAGASDTPAASTQLHTPVESPEFPKALGAQLSMLVRDGIQHAELHLNPAEMGPISIHIALDGTQAQVDFGADSAATREIIENGLPELAGALRDAGFTLSGGGVHQQASGQREGNRDGSREGNQGGPQQRLLGTQERADMAASVATPESLALARTHARMAAGGVDAYV